VSNVRLGAAANLEEHQLTAMLAAGVLCSISTDDPAMFETNLTRDYDAAAALGLTARAAFGAGVTGALCGPDTKAALTAVADAFPWP
jgi:aminodeoxyfutalosine deaminase